MRSGFWEHDAIPRHDAFYDVRRRGCVGLLGPAKRRPNGGRVCPRVGHVQLQGYLAHKKQPAFRTLQ